MKNLNSTWIQYASSKKLMNTGWILFGTGVGLEIIGLSLMISGANRYYYDYYANRYVFNGHGMYLAGYWLTGIGGALELAGIPTTIVGAVRKNKAISNYNMMYGGKSPNQYSQDVTFKAGIVGNGIGFSLNF